MATQPEGRRINPIFYVLLPLLLVVLIAFVYVNFLSGGGAPEEEVTLPTTPGQQVGAPIAPVATPAPTPESTEVFEIFEGRDPFRPLQFSPAPGATVAPG